MKEALLRLGIIALCMAGGASLSYFVPALKAYRPWTPDDPLPLVGVWLGDHTGLPGFAEAQGAYRSAGASSANVEKTVGKDVAAHLQALIEAKARKKSQYVGGGAGEQGASPESQTKGGRPHPTRGGEAQPHQGSAFRIDPEEYKDVKVPIVDPTGTGMKPFYEQLEKTAKKENKAITRVAHYGDSSIAADSITSTVRRLLQQRFGDAGHGFVLTSKGYMPYRHLDLHHKTSRNWSMRFVVKGDDKTGRYGYGGAVYKARYRSWSEFGTADEGPIGRRVSHFELWYRRQPKGGEVDIELDGAPFRTLSTLGEEADTSMSFDVPAGPHRFKVTSKGKGIVQLYGAVLERAVAGVVYDSLGLVGARALRMLNFQREHIRSEIDRRNVQLLVLGFGGNESGDRVSGVDRYQKNYAKVIQHVRKRSAKFGCLLFAPLDQAERDEETGKIRSMASLPNIVEAQRKAALEAGCAFFDTYTAMGGRGSMQKWYRSRLAMSDFRHATPAGYEIIGSMFYQALLKGFAEYLAR